MKYLLIFIFTLLAYQSIQAQCDQQPTFDVQYPDCNQDNGSISITFPTNGESTYNEIFISEVTDHISGTHSYVELYNGTGNSIDLTDYEILVYNNGNASPSCTEQLSGMIGQDETVIINLTTVVEPDPTITSDILLPCSGINDDDRLSLAKNGSIIDEFGYTDGTDLITQRFFTYRRKNDVAAPSTTFNETGDWDFQDWTTNPVDYSDVGNFDAQGTVIYTYALLNEPTADGTFIADTDFNNLPAGEYYIAYRAYNGSVDSSNLVCETSITALNNWGAIVLTEEPQPVTPIFDSVSPQCEGTNIAALPTTSNNGISGTWTPSINNTSTTTYTFTPNPNECAETTTLEIVIENEITPIFDDFLPQCEGTSTSPLPIISNNGVEGEWIPEFNPIETTTYTFLPEQTSCAISVTATIEIINNEEPSFSFDTDLCSTAEQFPNLPTISDNGISGTWEPNTISIDETLYTFTPADTDCYDTTQVNINFETAVIPEFDLPNVVCEGDNFELPLESINGVIGTWTPNFNSDETTTYLFTPSETNCAEAFEVTIDIEDVDFTSIENDIPANLNLECGEELPFFLELNADDYCGVEVITTEEVLEDGECNGELNVTRIWNIFDEDANLLASYEQIISFFDTTPPVFVGDLPENQVLNCNEEWPPIPELTAIDNCSDVNISVEENITEDPSCPQNFSLQSIFIATDDCGNTTTHEQIIEFIDDEGPVFDASLPDEVFLECGEQLPSTNPVVFDDCEGSIRLDYTDEETESCENGKTTIRTWEATDECGNRSFYEVRYIENCTPIVYEGISPNNDSINDYLEIEYITCYPDNQFQLFNRYGKKIHNITNYDNNANRFDGRDKKGNSLVTGTYFYVLEYRTDASSPYITEKGWVYVNRESY